MSQVRVGPVRSWVLQRPVEPANGVSARRVVLASLSASTDTVRRWASQHGVRCGAEEAKLAVSAIGTTRDLERRMTVLWIRLSISHLGRES